MTGGHFTTEYGTILVFAHVAVCKPVDDRVLFYMTTGGDEDNVWGLKGDEGQRAHEAFVAWLREQERPLRILEPTAPEDPDRKKLIREMVEALDRVPVTPLTRESVMKYEPPPEDDDGR